MDKKYYDLLSDHADTLENLIKEKQDSNKYMTRLIKAYELLDRFKEQYTAVFEEVVLDKDLTELLGEDCNK